jgi:hypothetical protein
LPTGFSISTSLAWEVNVTPKPCWQNPASRRHSRGQHVPALAVFQVRRVGDVLARRLAAVVLGDDVRLAHHLQLVGRVDVDALEVVLALGELHSHGEELLPGRDRMHVGLQSPGAGLGGEDERVVVGTERGLARGRARRR